MNIRIVKKWHFSSLMTTMVNYFQTGSIENTVCKVTSSLIANQRKMFPSCAVAIFVVQARKFGHLGRKYCDEVI
jgi:hypothetical protein